MILKEFSDWQKEGLGYKKISQDDSRDEQIIKGIYNALKYLELENSWDILCDEPYVDILDAYDWLEKQDNKKQDKQKEKFFEFKASDWYVSKVDGKIHNIYQSVDKIESKFKVGDWVILNGIVAKILDKQKYGFVGLDIDGKGFFCNYGHTDSMRLWSINDAKDGDVLVDEYNNIGLYSGEKDDLYWHSCIYLGCDDYLRGFMGYHKHKNTKLATKEQRDLLFSKMKEAGYKWDSVKKELKKNERR